MDKCDNCKLRQRIARAFDLHWLGEDDCPFGCPVEVPTIIPAEDLAKTIGKSQDSHEIEGDG